MTKKYSQQQKKLLDRLEEVRPYFLKDAWLHGYRPRQEFYHRLSIDWYKANELAIKGYNAVFEELGNKLYFTQALIAGIILETYKTNVSCILGTGYGKTYCMANINLIRAKRGEYITAFSPNKELNSVIFREMSAALLGSEKYKSLIFDSDSKAEALNKGASQRRFAFPSGGFVDLSLAKNYTSVHSSVYLDEYSELTDEISAGAQGRAGFYTTPDGFSGAIAKTSNPHIMNHSYLDMIRDPLSYNEAVIWGDYRLNVSEGVLLKRALSELRDEHAYLKEKNVYTDSERDFIFDKVLDVVKNNSFFRFDGEDLRVLMLSEFGMNTEDSFFTSKPIIDDRPENNDLEVYLGYDVAVRGTDRSIVARLERDKDSPEVRITDFYDVKPDVWDEYKSPEKMANNVLALSKEKNSKLLAIDATGVGQGQFNLLNMLNEDALPVIPINFGDGTTKIRKDFIGKNAMRKRAEMYLDFRTYVSKGLLRVSSKVWESLEAEYNSIMDTPTEKDSKIKVEEKSMIKKRLGRSPDYMDSCVLALHAYVLYSLYSTKDLEEEEAAEYIEFQSNMINGG